MSEILVKATHGGDVENIRIGTDGCGVPVFAVPLRNLAWAYEPSFMNPF